jgi:putative SOS response-associated peptidase YedK
MCRRFALAMTPTAASAFFEAEAPDFPPRADIAPGEPIELIHAQPFTRGAERRFMLARWGLLPQFVKEPLPLIVNARAETLLDRPSFAPAFRRRRCLIPASGFTLFANRTPYRVAAADGAPLGLAGLYETYLHANGSEIDTACIVTTEANAALSALGERMPVILPRAAFSAWLDCETTSLAAAQALLRPAPEAMLRADTFR